MASEYDKIHANSIVAGLVIGALVGNASTATAFETPRLINGVSFDGTSDVTVPAAAGTLTGSTLNATVTGSSLTSVGTIGTGTWNGSVISGQYGGTGVANTGKTITLGGNLTTTPSNALTFTTSGPTNVTLPTTGTLLTSSNAVTSITGTANQVIVSGSTGAVTLSLPQDLGTFSNPTFGTITASLIGNASTATALQNARLINGVSFNGTADITVPAAAGTLTGSTLNSGVLNSSLTSVGTIGTGTWNGSVISGQYGGTGVANTGKTMTLGGNFTTTPSNAVTFTTTGATNVTLPTSGTLATISGSVPSIAGTSNQVLVNGGTGSVSGSAVTLSLPQSIGTTSTPTFGNLSLTGTGSYLTTIQTTTTGSSNQVGLELRRGDQANGSAQTIYETGVTNNWSTGLRSGDSKFYLYDNVNSLATLTVTPGSGTSSTATWAGGVTANSFTGPLTGNASTATTLQTARNINGISFNGSADITVTAAAGTLTGSTLNATVTGSSLTSVGTIGTRTWNGSVIAGQYGGTGVANTGKTITLGGNLTTTPSNALTFTTTGPTNVTLPTSGTLLTSASGVSSITGTALQILTSGSTGAVTLSLPQNIDLGATVTFGNLNLTTGVSQPCFATLTTGSGGSGNVGVRMVRGDFSTGYAQTHYQTTTTNQWSTGLRQGTNNYSLYDEVNSTTVLSVTPGSGTSSIATIAGSLAVGTPITAGNGGTGLATYSQGDLLYASAGTTLSKLAKDTNSTRYLSNTGTSNNPAWAQIDLTTGVTGILPAVNGGTANGFTAFSGPTTSTKTFTLPNASATVLTTNAAVTETQGGTNQTTYTQGDLLYASATNTLSKLAKSTSSTRVLTNTGTSNNPAWAQLDLTSGVTGILPNTNTTATSSNTSSAIITRDGLGNFAAGTITATNFTTSSNTPGSGTIFWRQIPWVEDLGSLGTITITAVTSAPTYASTSTNVVYGYRIGSHVLLRYNFTMSGNGTAGSGHYRVTLPNSYAFDSTRVTPSTTASPAAGDNSFTVARVGQGYINQGGSAAGPVTCHAYDTTTFRLLGTNNYGAQTMVGSSFYAFSNQISFQIEIFAPINSLAVRRNFEDYPVS